MSKAELRALLQEMGVSLIGGGLDEAPMAYKNIEVVIGDLVEAGLVAVIATLRPLLTYKTRKERR